MSTIIYLDTCALNRLTDDLSQPRLRREAEAVARILEHVALEQVRWVASTALRYEISRNPHPIRRLRAMEVLSTANELIEPSPETLRSALELVRRGLSAMDAVHLATAEQVAAEFLITTDDRFVQRAARNLPNITVTVLNPVDWWPRRQAWLLPHS